MTFDFDAYDDSLYNKSPRQKVIEPDIKENKLDSSFDFDAYDDFDYQQQENKYGLLDTARDVGEQAVSKGFSGVVGSYGNILDTFGLQLKEGETLPGEKARNAAQFQVLEKISKGEVPSWNEFMLLSDDEPFGYSRLPTSKEVSKQVENLTGIGEGKTPEGRIVGRGAEFLGEGAATGGGAKALISLGLSGIAGQSVRESGGPEALATGIEVLGSTLPSAFSGKLAPKSKATKDIVEAGRKIGLSEKQITPLIQGEKKAAVLSKISRKGTKTKKLFSSIKEKLGDSYSTIKSSPEAKIKLPNADQINLRKEFGNIRNDLSKTLAPSPDKQAALDYIEKSLDTLRNVDVTPEYLVNFWQDINKSVNWNSLSGGKKSLAALKKPISDVLKKTSPQLAKDFEMTNELYTKYSQISKTLKPNVIDAFVNKGEILSGVPAAVALTQGNPWILGSLAGEVSLRILAREMLINPYFQNIGQKLVKNFNSGSAKGITQSVKQVKEYMMKKYPDENWGFLLED